VVLGKNRLNTITSQFLDQQNLVGILTAQAVRRVRQHNLDLPFSSEIPHTFKPRPLQRRSSVAVIFEDPLPGHLQIVPLSKLDQR
jgi:hypothetical protein